MEIKLTLSNEDMDRILEVSGYVTEEVQLWWSSSLYSHGCDVLDEKFGLLHAINVIVAYRIGERPESLNGEYPKLEENEQYKIDNVVQYLFKERLMKIMF